MWNKINKQDRNFKRKQLSIRYLTENKGTHLVRSCWTNVSMEQCQSGLDSKIVVTECHPASESPEELAKPQLKYRL